MISDCARPDPDKLLSRRGRRRDDGKMKLTDLAMHILIKLSQNYVSIDAKSTWPIQAEDVAQSKSSPL
jgi:hypothetical protein